MTGAQLYGRPEYLWMYHFIRTARPDAQGKVPAEPATSGWWPLTFAPSQPANFVGLQWAEPDETLVAIMRHPPGESTAGREVAVLPKLCLRPPFSPPPVRAQGHGPIRPSAGEVLCR